MKNCLASLLLLFSTIICAQVDYSNSWEDFYSYNNVKNFIKVDNKIYAIVDNAIFIYDVATNEIAKLSSVQGLSGETTSSLYYSKPLEKLVIGYQTGLIEVVDNKGKITISNDIERLNITGSKRINYITPLGNNLLIATPFAIVQYDLERLQFGDTYFIGNNSSEVTINQIEVFQNKIYAATTQGIFIADANSTGLIDFNNWQQPQGSLLGNFNSVRAFNNKLYASSSTNFYELVNATTTQFRGFLNQEIIDIKSSNDFLTVSSKKQAKVYNTSLNEVLSVEPTTEKNFTLNTAFAEEQTLYVGTQEYGILQRPITGINYTEIHPAGPTANDVFSITAKNNNIWVVYGGFDGAFTPIGRTRGFDHFNGENWVQIPFNSDSPIADLIHVTVDPNNSNKVYISSWAQTLNFSTYPTSGGILVVENDEPTTFWNQTNSGLESFNQPTLPDYRTIRVNGTAFDRQGNFWVTNALVANKLKKLTPDGSWVSYDLSSLMTNKALGLTELVIDKSNTIWIGTRRNGLLAFNENGNTKKALKTEITKGSLPDPNVRSIAVDRSNRIWIGTKKGLVLFSGGTSFFNTAIYDARPIIVEENGTASRLLGDQSVNSIAIDGADNKWFGTETGGVLGTNPSGQEMLFNFNKDNSPLPSNKIMKIQVDDVNGKVYFATDKGIVVFNNNVAPFGEKLGEVYAYPNPVKKEHNIVTIDGRNGTHIPRGTNVKILDASGRLVYETNVVEGQELKGGKVVWNKRNLANKKVASGVYIVLLIDPDSGETSTTKIAIIN